MEIKPDLTGVKEKVGKISNYSDGSGPRNKPKDDNWSSRSYLKIQLLAISQQ